MNIIAGRFRNLKITLALMLLALTVSTLQAQTRAASSKGGELTLSSEQASRFARLALRCVGKEFPNKVEHVMNDAGQAQTPRALHPAFYGCYDWHSSVHGHWLLARLLRLFPDLPEAGEIRAVLAAHLTADNLKAEAGYFARLESKSFERPYGWAWLLKLAEELQGWEDADAR